MSTTRRCDICDAKIGDWELRHELSAAGPVNILAGKTEPVIKDVCTECYGRIQALSEHLADVHSASRP